MRIATALITSLLVAALAAPAFAQQLRNPADPPPRAGQSLRQVQPVPRIPRTATGTRSVADPAARERCLQRATATIQPTAAARVTVAQRHAAAAEIQRAARGGDAADPTDQSGLRAQRDAQQRAATRERNAGQQRLALAQSNCR